jgi:hypothetical protein
VQIDAGKVNTDTGWRDIKVAAFARRVRAEADRLGGNGGRHDRTGRRRGVDLAPGTRRAAPEGRRAGRLPRDRAHRHGARGGLGETVAAAARREAGRAALLAGGKARIERRIADQFPALPAGATGDELRDVTAYLAAHPARLGYAGRLAAGRSIGCGLVEGSIKQLVNRRLKPTGARRRVDHVGPLVELGALIDAPDWHTFWSAA